MPMRDRDYVSEELNRSIRQPRRPLKWPALPHGWRLYAAVVVAVIAAIWISGIIELVLLAR